MKIAIRAEFDLDHLVLDLRDSLTTSRLVELVAQLDEAIDEDLFTETLATYFSHRAGVLEIERRKASGFKP